MSTDTKAILDQLKAEKYTCGPAWEHNDACQHFDGKRCRKIGHSPGRYCEPQVTKACTAQPVMVEALERLHRLAINSVKEEMHYPNEESFVIAPKEITDAIADALAPLKDIKPQ